MRPSNGMASSSTPMLRRRTGRLTSGCLSAARRCAQVKHAYGEVGAAQDVETLVQEDLVLVQRTVDLAQARLDAGEVGRVDLSPVRTHLINVQLETGAAGRDRDQAGNRLAHRLGLSRWQGNWKPADGWPEPQVLPSDDEQELRMAVEHRRDARMAALRVKAAEAELERQYHGISPNVQIGLEAERTRGRSQIIDLLLGSTLALRFGPFPHSCEKGEHWG